MREALFASIPNLEREIVSIELLDPHLSILILPNNRLPLLQARDTKLSPPMTRTESTMWMTKVRTWCLVVLVVVVGSFETRIELSVPICASVAEDGPPLSDLKRDDIIYLYLIRSYI